MHEPILGVILAGGQARRMQGQDKAFLTLGGRSLIAQLIAQMKPQLDALLISARGDTGRFAALGLEVITDANRQSEGPLAGVLAGLHRAGEMNIPKILSLPCDTPFLPPDLVERMAKTMAETASPIVIAASGTTGTASRAHPGVALLDAAARDPLQAQFDRGERALRRAYREVGMAECVWPADGVDPFFNINSPDDLTQAREIFRQRKAQTSPQ